MLGPLYHLVDRADRGQAMTEAARGLCPGGVLLAAAISRFASALNMLLLDDFGDPAFFDIVRQDLRNGQHRNSTTKPAHFTTAYFHHPDELQGEVEAAGLRHEATLAIEGPGGLMPAELLSEVMGNKDKRERMLEVLQALEREPSVIGVSPHVLVVARRP